MRKSLADVARLSVIAFAFSALSLSSVHAMPAPEPGTTEFGFGVTQWGAESEASQPMSDVERLATMLEKSRPQQTTNTKAAMCETLATAAQIHDLPVGFFVRLINQESGFKADVVSPAGAQGVAQFMPKVAHEWGLHNPFDPHSALIASARFLRSLYQQFGNWGLAAAAYNGGMGRVQKWIDKRGPLPSETRAYVKTITGVPAEKWVGAKHQNTKFSIPARAPCQEIAHLADSPADIIPLPPTRVAKITASKVIQASGPGSKITAIAAIAVKGGMKVAVINVKSATKVAVASAKATVATGRSAVVTKVAAVSAKIAAPQSLIADAAKSKAPTGKAAATVKLADKSTPKPRAKATDSKKASAKGRVQVADARPARK